MVVFRDPDGTVSGSKGSVCNLIEDGGEQHVEKKWVSGDWVFSADYEYRVEKFIYQQCNAMNLPVPRLLGFEDAERKLLLEYIKGTRVETPNDSEEYLRAVLRFQDRCKDIAVPASVRLWRMDEPLIHKYRLDQLKYIFPEESIWRRLDELYESFLADLEYFTIPFDQILKNAILSGETLFFVDFEWTISGPYEFTLARLAIEFNQYESPLILDRVGQTDLYHLFLLRFYMYGREPEHVYTYLSRNLANDGLQLLFRIVNEQKYAAREWCSL